MFSEHQFAITQKAGKQPTLARSGGKRTHTRKSFSRSELDRVELIREKTSNMLMYINKPQRVYVTTVLLITNSDRSPSARQVNRVAAVVRMFFNTLFIDNCEVTESVRQMFWQEKLHEESSLKILSLIMLENNNNVNEFVAGNDGFSLNHSGVFECSPNTH